MPEVVPAKPVIIQPFKVNQALVALKLGTTNEALLKYVNFLGDQIPTTAIQFLHVLQRGSLDFIHFEEKAKNLLGNFNLKEEVIENMRKQVERIIPNNNIALDYQVKEGYPLEELIYRSKLNGADLVIIGQDTDLIHHHILARNFLRAVKTNALIVPDKTIPKLTNILVPIDFSTYSLNALKTAVAINKNLKHPVPITCIHIYEIPNLTFYNVEKTKQEFKSIIEKDRVLAMADFIQGQIPDRKDRKYILKKIIEKVDYDIGFQICEYAKAAKTDLIIMGAKGHSKVEQLMMGSVTESVLGLNDRMPTFIIK